MFNKYKLCHVRKYTLGRLSGPKRRAIEQKSRIMHGQSAAHAPQRRLVAAKAFGRICPIPLNKSVFDCGSDVGWSRRAW
jgi:hypothetical protein